MNSIDVPQIHYDSTWFSANLLFIHYFSRIHYFVANSSWIQCLVREYTIFYANIPWIHRLLRGSTTIFCVYCELSTSSRDVSLWIIYFANSKLIQFLFCKLTIYFATQLWFHFLFHEFAIFFAKMQWIHYLFREFTNFFGEFTMNLLGVLRFTMDFREITIKSLFFREFTMNSLFLSRI